MVVAPQASSANARYVGTIEPMKETPLSFQTAGRVVSISVHNGQHVRQGQVIAQVDNTQAMNALRSAEATLQHAKDGFDRVSKVCRSIAEKRGTDGRLRIIEQFVEGCERVIVAGSTWPKDEELLAHYCHEYEDRFPDKPAKMIIVPHEIDEAHLHFLFNLFKGRMVRYSQVYNQPIGIQQHLLRYANVMVIDTMGLLSSIYRFGQVAYIGGGFGVGIHNTIEAAVYGIPVMFGPNYQHFREAKGLIAVGAGRSIRQYPELEVAFDTALEQHETIGAKAAEYVQSELGATDKIFKEIFEN
jgi:3-deoxy-D-manno-octulosonic-acid transferase